MRNKQLLRYSLASLMVLGAGFGSFLIACGDDDNTVGNQDAGNNQDSSTPAPDGGGNNDTDSGNDSGGGPVPAKLQLVNAVTDLGGGLNASNALRVCYAIAPTAEAANSVEAVAALPPLPDIQAPNTPMPALFQGTGGPVATTGASFEGLAIVPYIMSAASLKARGISREPGEPVGTTCKQLFNLDAGGAMTEGVDYWKLPAIPPGTLKNDKSYILVLTGCASNATAGTKCGSNFTATGEPGNGNLKVKIYEVDNSTAIDADKMGVQFIHASPAGDVVLADDGAVFQPAFIKDPANAAATIEKIAAEPGTVTYSPTDANVTPLKQIAGVDPTKAVFSANPVVDPAVHPVVLPLATIQQLTFGTATPPQEVALGNGKSFTFIALGDPELDLAGTPPNLAAFHFLALPNNPIIPQFE